MPLSFCKTCPVGNCISGCSKRLKIKDLEIQVPYRMTQPSSFPEINSELETRNFSNFHQNKFIKNLG
jgi:hypothetical protein